MGHFSRVWFINMIAWLPWFLVLVLATWGVGAWWRGRKLQAALAAAQAQLVVLAQRDNLTSLLNASGFEGQLDFRVNKVTQGGGSFCVLYLGLDNFGLLNDGFGKAFGDQLLVEVSKRITQVKGVEAEACRMNGGEYALVVNGGLAVGRQAAIGVLKKLAEPLSMDAINTKLSGSIGLAVYPEHGAREKILSNAALAMRTVRASGGGDYCLYEPGMSSVVREQAQMLSDLRTALQKGEFELYFQPKIDALSLQVTAAEALLRWRHPQRGFISPVVFIPVAEKHGLMGEIGNWVIEEACRHAAVWRESGLRMRVAVNISGYQMREEDLVDRISAALKRSNLQPERFTCEITESVAMEDTRVTQMTFEKMRQARFHVSIDDFGTGFSSLAMLRKLPAAELKIDRAFVSDLEESEDARSIAKSIVNMAIALNLRVVAEGVETPGQCSLLVTMGCTELQGYLFSKPVPSEELARMALDGQQLSGQKRFRDSLFQATNMAPLR